MPIGNIISTSGTLDPATPGAIAYAENDRWNPARRLLIIANNGINPMVIKFGSPPESETDGIPLDGASTEGGQGGSLFLDNMDQMIAETVYGYSTLGTTYAVAQG